MLTTSNQLLSVNKIQLPYSYYLQTQASTRPVQATSSFKQVVFVRIVFFIIIFIMSCVVCLLFNCLLECVNQFGDTFIKQVGCSFIHHYFLIINKIRFTNNMIIEETPVQCRGKFILCQFKIKNSQTPAFNELPSIHK